jgi:transposase InsO family protein
MDRRVAAAVTGPLDGLNVSALCRSLDISRQTLYKWRARYEAEGLNGLEERSRRPNTSPGRLAASLEDHIVALRKELTGLGVDAGAATIGWHLGRQGVARPPSEATIWRVLVRRGFVTPQPHKRPVVSYRRFEADFPNERWQADHCQWTLAGGTVVHILNVIDDHSRLCVASVAAPTVTGPVLWEAFWAAGQAWGLPSSCLTDNGLVFSGKLRGFEVDFERQLRQAGIKAITARPFHPQTCGKVERFQQTLKKWLRRRQRHLHTTAQLQAAIDEFVDYYNHHRPHRAIGRVTPITRFAASTPCQPGDQALAAAPAGTLQVRRSAVTITTNGTAHLNRLSIGVGTEYAGCAAQILITPTHASVYIHDQLIRHLQIDHTRRYQPTGRQRGGTRRHPN